MHDRERQEWPICPDDSDSAQGRSQGLPGKRKLTWAEAVVDAYEAETTAAVVEGQRVCASKTKTVEGLPWTDPPRLESLILAVNDAAMVRGRSEAFASLMAVLLRRLQPKNPKLIEQLVIRLAAHRGKFVVFLPTRCVLTEVEQIANAGPISNTMRTALRELAVLYKVRAAGQADREIHARIDRLLAHDEGHDRLTLTTGEAWAQRLCEFVNTLSPERLEAWRALFDLAEKAKSSKPSKRWLRDAETQVASMGERYLAMVERVLLAIGEPGDPKLFKATFEHRADPTQIHERHSDLLRGLVQMVGFCPSQHACKLLERVAMTCFELSTARLPRSLKVARACLFALDQFELAEASQALARLRSRVHHKAIRAEIDRLLERRRTHFEKQSWLIGELATPDFEFDADHVFRRAVANYTAEIRIVPPGQPLLTWRSSQDDVSHAVPRSVGPYHRDAILELRHRTQKVNEELATQKVRLEHLYLTRACWSYESFCDAYLHQPLIGPLVRDLIWRIDCTETTPDNLGTSAISAMWDGTRWIDADDVHVDFDTSASTVRPWHPHDCSADEVDRWRASLQRHQRCQPFNQAYREVHRFTGAPTATDDLRFVGHHLELRRMEQVVPDRNWVWSEVHPNGDEAVPVLQISDFGLVAKLQTIETDYRRGDVSLPRNTGPLQFCRLDDAAAVPISSVPPIVYSEVVREIEAYFLQYGSPGNIRTYYACGSTDQLQQYSREILEGPLTLVGVARRDAMQAFLQSSRFADRWRVEGRVLVVQGQLTDYRIDFANGRVSLADGRQLYPHGIAWSRVRNGLPPGLGAERMPFAGDVCLMNIVRDAVRLTKDDQLGEQQLLSQILGYLGRPTDGLEAPDWAPFGERNR